MNQTLTVTVLETATLFKGPDTVYRYDIIAAGIIEGWAVPAVVDQARQMCSSTWPDVDIIIDGDEQVIEMLTKTFIAKGVTSYPVETLREYSLPETEAKPPEKLDKKIKRPTKGRTVRHFYGIQPVHLALVSILVGTIAAAWLFLGDPATTHPAAKDVQPQVLPAAAETPVKETLTSVSKPATTVLETENLLVEVPLGFELELIDGGYTATGPDPNLKIHIGLDPLFGVDPELVAKEMQRMVEGDPALSALAPGEWGRSEVIEYNEDPGDGSMVHWIAWFQTDRQVSVGCHSRAEASLGHKASCRTVIESLKLK